ncbi:unnamed protein product [Victoria cruziana]
MAALECWSSRTSIDEDMVEQVLMKSNDRSEGFPSAPTSPLSRNDDAGNQSGPLTQKEWQRKWARIGRNVAGAITNLKTHLNLDSIASRISAASESRRLIWGSVVHDLTQLYPGSQLPEKLIANVRKHFDSLPLSYAQAGFDMKEVLAHIRLIDEAVAEDRPAVSIEEVSSDGSDAPRGGISVFRLSFACNSCISWPAVSCVLDDPSFCCKKMQIFERKSLTLGVVTVLVPAGQERAFRYRVETALRSATRRPRQAAMRIALGLCGCQEENIKNPAECEIGNEPAGRELPDSASDRSPLKASQMGGSSFSVSIDEGQNIRTGGEDLGQWLLNSDHVEVAEQLGSTVFKGVCRGKKVAITKIPGCERGIRYDIELRRDLLELMTCGHKNVLQFHGVLLHPLHGLCTVTKLMEGGSIDRLIRRGGGKKLQYKEIIKIATDIMEGMAFLNEKGVVYRDLNTNRVFLDRQGNACLGDMGVVSLCNQDGEVLEYETAGYRWLAPEIIAGDPESVVETEKSNVYSFGMILWEMVTGEMAYESYSPVQAAVGIAACGLRPDIPADCPIVLKSLMQKCWNNCPSKRPRFSDLLTALRAAASLPSR